MSASDEARQAPVLELVVPVYNEAHILDRSVRRLRAYVDQHIAQTVHLTIADNGSTDETRLVAERVAAELDGVRVLHLAAKGRGGALRAAWMSSHAPMVGYTDVDLSTDPSALKPMLAALTSGRCDIAVATRLHADARVTRGFTRDALSRGYNLLLRVVLGARFSDAQCGFKLLRADVARDLLPWVEDDGWFFDTELLVTAQRRGLRILDVAVTWVDDPDSRVDVPRTVLANLRGVARLRHGFGSPGRALTRRRPTPGQHRPDVSEIFRAKALGGPAGGGPAGGGPAGGGPAGPATGRRTWREPQSNAYDGSVE